MAAVTIGTICHLHIWRGAPRTSFTEIDPKRALERNSVYGCNFVIYVERVGWDKCLLSTYVRRLGGCQFVWVHAHARARLQRSCQYPCPCQSV